MSEYLELSLFLARLSISFGLLLPLIASFQRLAAAVPLSSLSDGFPLLIPSQLQQTQSQ